MQTEDDVLAALDDITKADKKKPGRPKKQSVFIPMDAHGVVDKPGRPGDLLELVYCNPIMFKRILHLYRAYMVSEVEMLFDHTGLHIVTRDHLGKSTMYTEINAHCMNVYYCERPLRICVKRENLERVLDTLARNHYKITFILRDDYRTTLYIVIKDLEYNNDDSYEIDVIYRAEDNAPPPVDDDTVYPIKFKLSSKHFKTKINNIRKISDTLTIQKCGDDPLQLTFNKAQQIGWIGIYNDPAKISLTSTLPPNDVFAVSVNIDYIKPFSNSNIGDDVWVAVDKQQRISFMTRLDQIVDLGYACSIKVFTAIKDYEILPGV